jgi:hypothetical protein
MNSEMEKKGEIIIYRQEDGKAEISVTVRKESLWLNLNQVGELFGRDKSAISRHLRNVFRNGELNREATVAFFATTQGEGGRSVERQVEYFNLDAILSVGYRVNSKRGTQFRIWANKTLKEYLIRGVCSQRKLNDPVVVKFR